MLEALSFFIAFLCVLCFITAIFLAFEEMKVKKIDTKVCRTNKVNK